MGCHTQRLPTELLLFGELTEETMCVCLLLFEHRRVEGHAGCVAMLLVSGKGRVQHVLLALVLAFPLVLSPSSAPQRGVAGAAESATRRQSRVWGRHISSSTTHNTQPAAHASSF